MDSKKVIVCDLDGTLAPSKSPLKSDMAEVIGHVLERHKIAVVSGGSYRQFQRQFLPRLDFNPSLLQNLSIFPAMGSTCYLYDQKKSDWVQVYDEPLPPKDKKIIKKALDEVIKEYGLDTSGVYGDLIEDRGGQITLSALGQQAPIDIKEKWDRDQAKRRVMLQMLLDRIPQFEIRIGGMTSIDITKKGLDKAYAMEKIKKLLKVKDEEIIFVGDALYKGGNDEAIKNTGVDFIQEDGPDQTLEFLSRYM